jgi:hypothetical protein
MTGRRMNWRKARLHGRPTLDFRYENDIPDRAERWLKAVERRQRERRRDVGTMFPTSSGPTTVSPSTNWSTVADSTGPMFDIHPARGRQ